VSAVSLKTQQRSEKPLLPEFDFERGLLSRKFTHQTSWPIPKTTPEWCAWARFEAEVIGRVIGRDSV
jgi:hypothetical protein